MQIFGLRRQSVRLRVTALLNGRPRHPPEQVGSGRQYHHWAEVGAATGTIAGTAESRLTDRAAEVVSHKPAR